MLLHSIILETFVELHVLFVTLHVCQLFPCLAMAHASEQFYYGN
jgi:hypothetical protein